MTLRPYQVDLLQRLREALRSSTAALAVAPTGAGKTRAFCEIARSAARAQRRVWIVVHRQELLTQTSRALDEAGVAHGVVASGFTAGAECVQVAMVATLRRRLEAGKISGADVSLVIFDEAHHAVAGDWRRIRAAIPRAKILGFTATPERLDGTGLGEVFDSMVIGPSTGALMRDGYLCRADVYAPPVLADLSGVRSRAGDFAPGELAERIDTPKITGDAVAHYWRICHGAPAIAFCASVAHAEHVAEQFRAAGFRSESIDGTLADGLRRRRIAGLADGSIQVLTSCDIVSEGTDIPLVTAAILLRATQSLALCLQQIGRALRPVYAPGFDLSTRDGRLASIAASIKPAAIILDHVGNTAGDRHGLPEFDRTWTLEARPRARRGANANGPTIRVTQCPECWRQHTPAPACPSCGHAYRAEVRAPAVVAGELARVTNADEVRERMLRQQRAREVQRAVTFDDLQRIGRERNYRPEWARHMWQARQRRNAR